VERSCSRICSGCQCWDAERNEIASSSLCVVIEWPAGQPTCREYYRRTPCFLILPTCYFIPLFPSFVCLLTSFFSFIAFYLSGLLFDATSRLLLGPTQPPIHATEGMRGIIPPFPIHLYHVVVKHRKNFTSFFI
jgi:hypothetical protein